MFIKVTNFTIYFFVKTFQNSFLAIFIGLGKKRFFEAFFSRAQNQRFEILSLMGNTIGKSCF